MIKALSLYWPSGTSVKMTITSRGSAGEVLPNQSLQGTFDPSPIFAAAKTVAASNAPELKR